MWNKADLTSAYQQQLLNEVTRGKYTLRGLKEYIETCTQHIRITMPHLIFNVVCTPSTKPHDVKLQRVCARISNILRRHNFGEVLVFHLVPFDEMRRFPSHEKVTPAHINGAYTYPAHNEVYIYRLEEFPKVALHEMCHHLPVHSNKWNTESLEMIYTFFNISSKGCPMHCHTNILPNEAVVEAWAIMHNCQCIAREYGISYDALLKAEVRHGMIQTKKLLQHQKKHFPLWEEDTHSFSYIILRTILLFFKDDFIKMQTPYDTIKLSKFMIDGFRSQSFQDALDHTRVPAIDRHHMRMTRFGDF